MKTKKGTFEMICQVKQCVIYGKHSHEDHVSIWDLKAWKISTGVK